MIPLYIQTLDSFLGNLKNQDLLFDPLVIGSVALKEAGLPMKKDPQDIDLALGFDQEKYYEEAQSILSSLHNSLKQPILKDYPDSTPNQFKISWRGVKMDIWIYKREDFQKLLEECNYFKKYGIKFADIKSTLEAKLRYNREKDLEDLIEIINELTFLVGKKKLERKDPTEIG